MTKSPAQARHDLTKEILDTLDAIRARVDGDFTSHRPTDWGHVGTLEKIKADLAEVARFAGVNGY